MKKTKKTFKFRLYLFLLVLSIVTFTLCVFVFQKPDGAPGLIICILSIYMAIGSIIKLCRMSEMFENAFWNFLDLIFWLP